MSKRRLRHYDFLSRERESAFRGRKSENVERSESSLLLTGSHFSPQLISLEEQCGRRSYASITLKFREFINSIGRRREEGDERVGGTGPLLILTCREEKKLKVIKGEGKVLLENWNRKLIFLSLPTFSSLSSEIRHLELLISKVGSGL